MEFLLFGTVFFWIALLVLSTLLIAAIQNDNGYYSTLMLIAILIFFEFAVPNVQIFAFMYNNPLSTLLYIGGYFVIGSCWTIIKWYFYLINAKDVVIECKKRYCNNNKLSQDYDVLNDSDFINALIQNSNYPDKVVPPSVKYHKGDILMWASCWPWSAFWTLLNDPIRWTWNSIIAHLGGMMQRLSNKIFSDI